MKSRPTHPRLASASLIVAALAPAAGLAADALCASPQQAAKVREAFSKPTPPAPFAAAAELKLAEALVVSALPDAQAHGVEASHFQTVWKSLQTWDNAVFVVMQGGHVFETYGKVPAGEPSKRSNYFNIHAEGAGISGHLRPDLLSSIYVISIPGKESTMRGVMFYDRDGKAAFGVYVPGEGTPPPDSLVKQFEATAEEIRALPAVCAAPAR